MIKHRTTHDLTTGSLVTVEFRPQTGDLLRPGHVTGVEPDGSVVVYFGPWMGSKVFGPDGFERTSRRWGARLVEDK